MVRIPSDVSISWFLVSLILPGFGFIAAGFLRTGLAMIGVFGAALLTFIVGFGLPCASVAFAIILTIHSISLGVLIGKIVPALRFGGVPLACVGLLVVLYLPLQSGIAKFVMPLELPTGVVIVRSGVPETLGRGDWVAYRIAADHDTVRVRAGLGLDRVLAQPGDAVEFSKSSFTVNGESFPRLDYMPDKGGFILSKGQWFVWPTFSVGLNHAGFINIPGAFLRHSIVSRNDIFGIPCGWWFWRRPHLP
jgi:hypothetical protein